MHAVVVEGSSTMAVFSVRLDLIGQGHPRPKHALLTQNALH
jgi:hypothetical protein